jgi:hypothetical protein
MLQSRVPARVYEVVALATFGHDHARQFSWRAGIEMVQLDVENARRHYLAMRDLIIHHRGGWRDAEALGKLWDLSRKAAATVDDADCKSMLLAVDDYCNDLFSESGHQKWARTQMSGADFLRLQILRELDGFHARIFQLEATRNAAARLAAKNRPDRRSPS